jgi:hypothetical protein
VQLGSLNFDAYARNLRRIMWAEFVDEQMRTTRAQYFRASLVESPFNVSPVDIAPHLEYFRNRTATTTE